MCAAAGVSPGTRVRDLDTICRSCADMWREAERSRIVWPLGFSVTVEARAAHPAV